MEPFLNKRLIIRGYCYENFDFLQANGSFKLMDAIAALIQSCLAKISGPESVYR